MAYVLTGLEGKVAVVTGAGRMRSIGRPIAVELARAGCDVVVTGTGRDPSTFPEEERAAGWRDIESVADEIRALGRRALPVVTSVADPDAVEALAERVVAELGRVDVLVNNAGAARAGDRVPLLELSVEQWRTVLSVNLDGAFYASKAFAARMGPGSSFVNISSVGGKIGGRNTAAYSASKAGLHALTQAMSAELGPAGIRVNAICPGIIDTSRLDDIRAAGAWERTIERNIPLGRAGTGEDVAHAAVFLCSDQGSWVTGQQWNVDGGQLTIR
jgi:NAD(P)-dependent dehydrogenase (short-subunit alcohol dehydrogenase family)